jgi:hypothetical protein
MIPILCRMTVLPRPHLLVSLLVPAAGSLITAVTTKIASVRRPRGVGTDRRSAAHWPRAAGPQRDHERAHSRRRTRITIIMISSIIIMISSITISISSTSTRSSRIRMRMVLAQTRAMERVAASARAPRADTLREALFTALPLQPPLPPLPRLPLLPPRPSPSPRTNPYRPRTHWHRRSAIAPLNAPRSLRSAHCAPRSPIGRRRRRDSARVCGADVCCCLREG